MLKLKNSTLKWICLFVGSLGYLLSGPVFQIGIAGWMIPIGILYFFRASKVWKGFLWSVLFITVFAFISGLFSAILPPVAVLISAILSGVLESIPFLLDRVMYKRLRPGLTLFLFPVVAVSYEYLISFPLSSIGVLAATQTDFIELAQLASITGVFGISFMMYWFASLLVTYLLEEEKRVAIFKPFAILFGLILLFGVIKLRIGDPTQKTVKVAGIVLEEYSFNERLYEDLFGENIDFDITSSASPELGRLMQELNEFIKNAEDERFKGTHRELKKFEDRIVELTASEAKNGAQIIVWSETNLPVLKKDEQEVLNRIRQIAKEEQVTIVTSMAVLLPFVEDGPLYENKSVVITNDGEIVDYFEKANPVPFLDASLPGDGRLDIVSTPYGDITTAICYDADFPELITQAGSADILLVPANDWLGVSPYHGDYSMFRAIENGVSVVRPTGTGQSVVFNPHGQGLARLDAFDKEVRIINAHVPVAGVTTIYNYIGNGFAKLCLVFAVGMIGMVILGFVRK